MAGPLPKGRGSPPQAPRKASPKSGGPGAMKDTKCSITVLAVPKGNTRMLRILLKGYGTAGVTASEDGTEFSFNVERRKAAEVLFKIRKLWNEEQIRVTFAQNGQDITDKVVTEPPPKPVTDEAAATRTQAMVAKARAAQAPAQAPQAQGAKPPGQPPGQQAWGWKDGARDATPPVVPVPAPPRTPPAAAAAGAAAAVEGKNGVWTFGNGYRTVDADKIDTQMKRKVVQRDGKQKITLGVNSDRQYLIEPDRVRGGWSTSRLVSDFNGREYLGNAPDYRSAVMFVRDYEEQRAQTAPEAPAAPAPATAPVAPTVPSAPAVPAARLPAPAPAPTAGGFAMVMLSPSTIPGTPRWAVMRGAMLLAASDDLEQAIAAAYQVSGSPMLVVGWNGQSPAKRTRRAETVAAVTVPPPPPEDEGEGLEDSAEDEVDPEEVEDEGAEVGEAEVEDLDEAGGA